MNLFLLDWLLHNFLSAEGSIAGGIKICGLLMKGALFHSPLLDFI
jgi:hypothetical protein